VSSSLRVPVALSTALGALLCSVPLFGVHGVESAIALGALLPPLCAALGARAAIRLRAEPRGGSGELIQQSIVAALLVLAAPVLVLGLDALRVRNCAPLEGLTFIALGPFPGVVLAALVGAVIGSLVVRPWLAVTLAALVPVADALRALLDFYTSPAVFAYGHFFGYFPGPLYDELVELPGALWTLRAVTACAVLALIALLAAHRDPDTRRLRLRPRSGRGALSLVALACAGLFGLATWNASALGHRGSSAHVAEVLGARFESARCELIVPRELRRERRQRLADDCDYRVGQMERFFGLRQPSKVRVLYFRSAGEKRALMGAAGTNVAKPWRGEIYLQDDSLPHPVIAHELAHVVAGQVGRGLLRITGPLHGLIPDFALVEGMAVAAAWTSSASAGMTPHQWTRAMLELGLLPRLDELFGAGFLAQQKRLAYTVSGSFLRFVSERYGKAALRRIYETSDVPASLRQPLERLEAEFHAFLRTVDLPPAALALARQRFEGKSVLSAVCPHEKARLRNELDGQLVADDGSDARVTCSELLAIDPTDATVRSTRAVLLAREGHFDAAERELSALRAAGVSPSLLASARHGLADEAWRRGRFEQARAGYEALLREPVDRDSLRMLQVKALSVAGSPLERSLVFGILVGEPGQATDGATAVHFARELRRARSDGLPHYLEARQLMLREKHALAAELLAQARALGLPTPELAFEALRNEAASRFGAGQLDAARSLWTRVRTEAPAVALREEADEWLDRIAFAKRAR